MDKRNGLRTNDEVIGRISDLLKQNGKLEKDLIEYLGLTRGTYTNWKANRSDSFLHFLKEISEYFQVTPNYLLLGEDAFLCTEGQGFYTKDELEVISMYRKASAKEKKNVMALLRSMTE